MIFLFLSLISSSAIFLIFKGFEKFKVHTLQAIVINYFTATVLGLLLISPELSEGSIVYSPLIRNGALLGFLFIGLFYLMAKISQDMGAGISSVATKLSLVIPSIFFMLSDPADPFSWLKVMALIVAIPGVHFTVYNEQSGKFKLLLPLLLFIGSGALDIILAYTDQHFSTNNVDRILLTFIPFMVAGTTGLCILIFGKNLNLQFSKNTLVAGTILGIVNFASIFYLLKTFESIPLNKSQIIPINNLGIVVISSLSAFILMKENLSKTNKVGLFISILAISILLFDSLL